MGILSRSPCDGSSQQGLAPAPPPPRRSGEPLPPGALARRDPVRELDSRARELRVARDGLVLPLARAAHLFVRREAWRPFGYAGLADFCRERLGRSARWIRDLADLHAAVLKLPALADALVGADGGPPLGRTAALWVGKTASPDSIAAWIALARSTTARLLLARVRAARVAGSAWPASAETQARTAADTPFLADADDLAETWTVRMRMPLAVRVAFEETRDLHHAVSGREAGVAAFVEALVGEACAAGAGDAVDGADAPGRDPDVFITDREPAAHDSPASSPERAVASTEPAMAPDHQPAGTTEVGLADELLARVAALGDAPEPVDLEALAERLQALVLAEDAIERALGRLLAALRARAAWPLLGCTSLGAYAEAHLGWGRSTAEARAWLARTLPRTPHLNAAYESGRLGFEAALIVGRIFGRRHPTPDVERHWARHAARVTIKHLRDDARLLDRRRVGEDPNAPPVAADPDAQPVPPPPTHAERHASLRRAPGDTRARIARLGERARAGRDPNVFVTLRLPEDLARQWCSTLEWARRELEAQARNTSAPPSTSLAERPSPPHPAALPEPASLRAARHCMAQGRRVPAWAGLLALLEDFARTWDDPRASPKREWDPTYERDGNRCMAPGCTRRDVQDHHIVYRADQGSDELSNQISTCPFHHLQGEHGQYARVRGRAPTDLVWRLGRKDLAVWYRNDHRLPPEK